MSAQYEIQLTKAIPGRRAQLKTLGVVRVEH